MKASWLTYLRERPLLWQGGLILLAILLPLPLGDYYRTVAWRTALYVMLGLSLNLIVGYAGLFQLGHAAFYALGAYTAAILNLRLGVPMLWTFPASILVAALFGFLIARPILHLRGDYLAIVTIAFGEVVRVALVNNIFGITGGANGLSGIARPRLLGLEFRQPIYHYYLVLFFLLITIFAMRRLENSRLGRAWLYIREDETAAEAMGINTAQVKLLAFVLGSGWAGLAGALYAARITVISPDLAKFMESVMMFCIVVLGGTGSIPGVFIGALGMITLPELFRALKDWRDAWLGVAMVVMMIARPEGLWPSRRVQMEIREAK
ncbi:MAG: branched-chain amino acid ABC transporter permease [Anaerolineae bacterium]|nr:branched-chain amino acid ABC transporter permease [Anaerolineae bacterium]HOV49435.1 branched-chain amino acid ABC transporter permease [Anaerolineae bacterium]HXK43951.1 branched-chain amino acid ABC transporter permease [Anaerolineae bacterium]